MPPVVSVTSTGTILPWWWILRKAVEPELMVAEMETMNSAGAPDPRELGGPLNDVRAFCIVVELGSISAAAGTLGRTKGAISRRVTRLEGRLSTTLLARRPRAVSVTEEGLAFHIKVPGRLLPAGRCGRSSQRGALTAAGSSVCDRTGGSRSEAAAANHHRLSS